MSVLTKMLHPAFVLITSVPVSVINFSAYLKGGDPDAVQILASIIYVVIWGVYGFLLGRRGMRFAKFATYYWGIGTLLYTVAYSLDMLLVGLPILFILAGPLYGLTYFYELPPGIAPVIINTLIVYSFSMLGYRVGKRLGKPL